MSRSMVGIASKVVSRTLRTSIATRFGRFRSWPNEELLLSEPLAMAEERTNRLRRIYANCMRDSWDGPTLFREAMTRHGGIQLDPEKRIHLSYPISMLMWGELAAWIVSAELAERLEDPDARMAASSQVFDEARHFYTLRDYLAALHVPVPKLDTYFAIGARRLLMSQDLNLKLFAMQILAEGTAQAIFRFLADAKIEPVLTDLLPYIERDEARHVGLGVLHLPERLAKLSPKKCRALASQVGCIGDLFGATQIRYIEHYRAMGAEPRDLFRAADKMLHELSSKLGNIPGTDEPYFRTANPQSPEYDRNLSFVIPRAGRAPGRGARIVRAIVDFGARALPA